MMIPVFRNIYIYFYYISGHAFSTFSLSNTFFFFFFGPNSLSF